MTRTISIAVSMCILAACGGSSGTDAGTDAGGGTDMGGGTDAGPHDSGATDSGGGTDLGLPDLGLTDSGGTDSGPACSGVLLKVKNTLNWCSVSVSGMAASSGAEQTVCVTSSSDVSMVATALTGFQLGDWHHTTGDTGSGDPGVVSGMMSTAHIMVGASGTACVWVCCPFVGGTGCPTTDQCP